MKKLSGHYYTNKTHASDVGEIAFRQHTIPVV